MPQTTSDLLLYLSSQAGAGVAASVLFRKLRCWFPAPHTRPNNLLLQWLYRLLHTPRYALFVSGFLLPVLVGVTAAGVLAYQQGGDIFDAAWGFLAVIVSQFWYRWGRMETDDAWESQ